MEYKPINLVAPTEFVLEYTEWLQIGGLGTALYMLNRPNDFCPNLPSF